ncbi:MAG: U32 family peptidase [Alistipes sp.]|nr:U32 family peptidase [Alistipes sp.]MBQ5618934.1 U32 family peptidase [Alistipes sp.]MBQ5923111.1 U32 family peptidase [Alistipes sp.]
MRYIELLSPAKDYDTARAAVDHGADAIYMGAARFGARRAAANSLEDVARTVEYAHQYGVRVHSTLNTVLYDNELADAEHMARELIATGIDALIVQDMALREMNLPVELHASTQAGTTTPEQALFLEQCGFSRVILERALTLEDIRRIREATSVELECFVHGAICVGYSGRCFLSRSTSQRSGNRGECSQPCRLPYDLKDSSGRTIMAGKHLLSVRDLDLSEDLEALIDAGISSFKIEGRLKDVRYIKNVVNYYRRQIDDILARRKDIVRPSVGRTITEFEPNPQKSFTRGASQYMLHGKRSGVASFDTPKAVGEYLGRIVSLTRKGFTLSPACDLTAGDGICIISAEGMSGTNINAVEGGNIIPNRMDGIVAGADVYRNYDHRFALAVDRSRTRRTIDATAHLTLTADGISLTIKDCEGISATITRDMTLEPSSDQKKMTDTARRAIEKSGGTIFSIGSVEVQGGEYFAPASLLADVRREALEALRQARLQRTLPHLILSDDGTARYPYAKVSRYENVTNHLARKFYHKHGAELIETALETLPTTDERVMISSYCIRREIGQCLKHNPSLKGELYIEHGTARYRLEFDCKQCCMHLIHCTPNTLKR